MKTYTHRISIPSILQVDRGNLTKVGYFIKEKGFSKVTLFFGAGIQELFGNTVIDSIKESKLQILKIYDHEENEINRVVEFAFGIPEHTEVIIGVGGGKVLDVAKYISFLTNLPFISIPTSTSNDGFSSSGCSLFFNGWRKSVPARIPFGIIVDIDVIKSSPEKLIYSGIGDLISKITAVYDWEFEEISGYTRVNDFAVMIAKKSVNSIARMELDIDIRDQFFLKELVDSLTMSGIAMEIAGNSAPASGSEHLISHALDKFLEKPHLHGIQVGIATYLMSKVQNHRYQRVAKFLTETGFFEHVKTLKIPASDYEKAIEIAPTIKPNRSTYIHNPENRAYAKQLLYEDEILKNILI